MQPGPWELPPPDPLWVHGCRWLLRLGAGVFIGLFLYLLITNYGPIVERWIQTNVATGFRW